MIGAYQIRIHMLQVDHVSDHRGELRGDVVFRLLQLRYYVEISLMQGDRDIEVLVPFGLRWIDGIRDRVEVEDAEGIDGERVDVDDAVADLAGEWVDVIGGAVLSLFVGLVLLLLQANGVGCTASCNIDVVLDGLESDRAWHGHGEVDELELPVLLFFFLFWRLHFCCWCHFRVTVAVGVVIRVAVVIRIAFAIAVEVAIRVAVTLVNADTGLFAFIAVVKCGFAFADSLDIQCAFLNLLLLPPLVMSGRLAMGDGLDDMTGTEIVSRQVASMVTIRAVTGGGRRCR
mmetsp:Transcript_19214/g.53399  ORF Transcript_19214/g.53399 Transcript_19214/m.53399 type:complete len:287 (+) Transcript_19214:109-969(+)